MKTGYFYENQTAASAINANIERVKAIIQEAVNEFNAIAATPLTDLAEVRSLFKESGARRDYIPERAKISIIDRIIQSDPLLKALRETGSAEALRGLVDAAKLPDLTRLNDAMNKLTDYQPGAGFRDMVAWQAYHLDGATVTVIVDQVERLKEPYRERATTAEQMDRLAAAQKVSDAMNALYLLTSGIRPDELTVPGVTLWQGDHYAPAPRFVMYGKAGALTIADFAGRAHHDAMRSTPSSIEPMAAAGMDDAVRGAMYAKQKNNRSV